jgi:hypothetical protein
MQARQLFRFNTARWIVAALLVAALVASSASRMAASQTVSPGSCQAIQSAIDALPPGGGEVIVLAGTYVCDAPIVIDRNNVKLRGEGMATVIRVANGANIPAIIVGQTINEPTTTRRGIQISDLLVDGNRAHQTFECWGGDCDTGPHSVRNNGITLRRVRDVLIENVTTRRARSGGVVVEKGSRRVTIRDLWSYENELDGFAAYETRQSLFTGLHLFNNCFAGVSVDLDFDDNVLSDVSVFRSPSPTIDCPVLEALLAVPSGTVGTVGVFIRDARDNVFRGLRVTNSREHGVFIADAAPPNQPASGNSFFDVVIEDAGRHPLLAGQNAIHVADASCVNTLITGAQLINPSGSCVFQAAPVVQSGVICR